MVTTGMSIAQFIGLLVAPLMALLVGFVTKESWPDKWKSLLLLALSAINGVVVEAFTPHAGGYDLRASIMSAIYAFVVAIGFHYGLLKPTGATAAVVSAGVKDQNQP